MRLEINIADELPEAKILRTVSDPTAFVLDLVRRSGQTPKPTAIPDYASAVEQIRKSPSFKSKEEIDTYIAELRAEW